MGVADSEQVVRVIVPETDLSYTIVHGIGLFPRIAGEMKELAEKKGGKPGFAIVTDSKVAKLYANPLEQRLRGAGLKADTFVFQQGEPNKNIHTLAELALQMSASGYDRSSVILALGGGVVGDVAGMLAALYMRGVDYIQIPTTLLAQADSSIGGKTAVDVSHVKNLVGRFLQPKRVYIDVETLKTLPDREIRSGLAETIKHGIIADAEFFGYLEQNLDKILARSEEHLLYISQQNCRIKGKIVEIDPNEKGLRKVLNYGHTIGHAVEALSGYALNHGEAVSIGMMPAAVLAVVSCGFPKEDMGRQRQLLERAGLPTRIPTDIPFEDIIRATAADKKARGGNTQYVLPVRIGEMADFNRSYAASIDKPLVLMALQAAGKPL